MAYVSCIGDAVCHVKAYCHRMDCVLSVNILMSFAAMQALLPGCNVANMVQLQPQLFLSKSTQQLQTQVGTAYDIISRDLPTDYVDAMVQVAPGLHPISMLGRHTVSRDCPVLCCYIW